MNFDGKQPEVNEFLYDESYHSLKQEAHNRGASECIAPSLIWHLGVWPARSDDPQDAEDEDDFNLRLERWINVINEFLERLQQQPLLKGMQCCQRFGIVKKSVGKHKGAIWRSDRSDVEFDLLWRGLHIQVRVGIHTDYATITLLTNLPAGGSHEYKDRIEAIFNEISASKEQQLAAAVMLYDTVWSEFVDEVMAHSARPDKANDRFHPGQIFVSLRGVVPTMEQAPQEDDGWMSRFKLTRPQKTADGRFDEIKSHTVIKAHEFFITPYGFPEDPREFVACRVMGNRALFASALGAVSKRQGHPGESPYHIRYVLFVAGKPNHRQLGRHVELINTLSTLQIIAIKNLKEIRDVGTQIRLTGDYLDKKSEDFHRSIEQGETDAETLELDLCQLETELERISKGPVGGLQYRVARSRYYSDQFDRRIKDLGIEAIDRWQTYDAFARRHIIPVFAYISSVGKRMINLRTRLHTILESVQTKILIELNDGLLRLHKSGQFQTFVLFVIALAAFCGEVVEPMAKMGGRTHLFLQDLLPNLGDLSTCNLEMLKLATNHVVKAGEATPPDAAAAKEACAATSKFTAYLLGIALAVAIAALSYPVKMARRLLKRRRRGAGGKTA